MSAFELCCCHLLPLHSCKSILSKSSSKMLMSNLLDACWPVLSEFGLNATMTTSYVPADVKSFAETSIPIGGVQTWAVPQDVGRRKLRHSGISSWIDTVGLAHAYRIHTSSGFPHLPRMLRYVAVKGNLRKLMNQSMGLQSSIHFEASYRAHDEVLWMRNGRPWV